MEEHLVLILALNQLGVNLGINPKHEYKHVVCNKDCIPCIFLVDLTIRLSSSRIHNKFMSKWTIMKYKNKRVISRITKLIHRN